MAPSIAGCLIKLFVPPNGRLAVGRIVELGGGDDHKGEKAGFPVRSLKSQAANRNSKIR